MAKELLRKHKISPASADFLSSSSSPSPSSEKKKVCTRHTHTRVLRFTVEPPIMDTPKSRQPPYNRQTVCPLPVIFLPPKNGQPLNNGQNAQKSVSIIQRFHCTVLASTAPCIYTTQNPDSKHDKYREQVRMMLSELQTPSSSHLPRPSANEDNELSADSSTTSLPEIHEKEEHNEPQIPQKRSEEEGVKEKTREASPGLEPNEIVSYDDEPRAHRPGNDSFKRRVGVVNRPQVVVVGGGADSAHSAGKPRSSQEIPIGGEKGHGQANEVPPPSQSRAAAVVQKKPPPVKELQIKPVVSKPSVAAQQLLESKRQQRDGGGGGGGRGVTGVGGEGDKNKDEDEGAENGDTADEKETGGGSKLEVHKYILPSF